MSFFFIFFIIVFCYNLFHRDFSMFKSLFNAALWTIALWISMFAFFFVMAGIYFLTLTLH